jgi:hypothetical protein
MVILCFYVPTENLEEVKNALFNIGAGRFNNYDCCCWESKGTGQFRPLINSNPHIGIQDKIEKVEEFKVEMVCKKEILPDIISELLRVHPYEEVAYHLIEQPKL